MKKRSQTQIKNKNIKIVFDGLSGIGKTYWIDYLIDRAKLTHYNGVEEVKNEIRDLKNNIYELKNQTNLIENSLINGILVKQFLCNYGYINKQVFDKCLKLFQKNIHHSLSYLHILLTDDYDKIKARRTIRGRKFEYQKDFKFQYLLDKWLFYNTEQTYQQYGINYLKFYLSNQTDLKKFKKLIQKFID